MTIRLKDRLAQEVLTSGTEPLALDGEAKLATIGMLDIADAIRDFTSTLVGLVVAQNDREDRREQAREERYAADRKLHEEQQADERAALDLTQADHDEELVVVKAAKRLEGYQAAVNQFLAAMEAEGLEVETISSIFAKVARLP